MSGRIQDIKAVVMLAGSVRASSLRRVIKRLVLELPLDADSLILDQWHHHWSLLAKHAGLDQLNVRIMIDRDAPEPMEHRWNAPLDLLIQTDPEGFRGTGGLLKDFSREFDPDDMILVVDGAMLVVGDVIPAVEALSAVDADVAILTDPVGEPSGLLMVRCGCLESIASVGYIDFKEQALPRIAEHGRVRAVPRAERFGLPIRTLEEYVHAVRLHHCVIAGEEMDSGPFAEDWWPKFALSETGAEVDQSAVLHDSVVLAGGRVQSNAVLVRSLVGPGGVVPIGGEAIELPVAGREG